MRLFLFIPTPSPQLVEHKWNKDRKGNLRAGAMIQLEQHARRFGDPLFIEGVEIIRQSYRPVDSCQFVSASWKDDHGLRHTLPLSLAAME